MRVYLKNKPSSLNTIAATGIILFLMMSVLSSMFLIPAILNSLSGEKLHIIEFRSHAGSIDLDQIKEKLNLSQRVKMGSVQYISKAEAENIMSNDIDPKLRSRIDEMNPFRDIIKFSMAEGSEVEQQDFITKLSEYSQISGIYKAPNIKESSNSLVGNFNSMVGGILLLLLGILGYLFYHSLAQTLISRSKEQIKSLAIYGSSNETIIKNYGRVEYLSVLKGWLFAIVLYILLIYLLIGLIGLSFSDIPISRLVLALILPLLLVLSLYYFLIKKSFTKYLNSL